MDWRFKCLVFHLLWTMPGGGRLHRTLRWRVTGRYLMKIPDDTLGMHRNHIANYGRFGYRGCALEFGAGPLLLTVLLLSAADMPEIVTLDIERLATTERLNHAIRRLRNLRDPGKRTELGNLEAGLMLSYHIRYLAPADVRATGMPPGSVDFLYLTSTLEHIAEPDIVRILNECVRIGAPAALMSFAIGYYDYNSTCDRSITRSNVYRYSDLHSSKFNPPHHYQDRLRHSDYEKLFASLGLTILSARRQDRGQSAELDDLPLADRFLSYDPAYLLTHNGHFLPAVRGGRAQYAAR